VTVACLLLVVNIRRSAVGRRFLAVRINERAAAAVGIDVACTKLTWRRPSSPVRTRDDGLPSVEVIEASSLVDDHSSARR
jgi:hypothetical protein